VNNSEQREAMVAMLKSRRSVPASQLVEPGPSPEQLETILTIAARVPDHGKLAPWRFIVFAGTGRAAAGEIIARVHQADNPAADEAKLAQERGRLTRAPLVVGVVCRAAPHVKIPEWEQQLSVGAACMNLIVAANAMGFGTVWLTEWYSYDRRVADGLGLAPHERMAGFVHIGTAVEKPADRTRPALREIVRMFEG
jgi:nitroreductase